MKKLIKVMLAVLLVIALSELFCACSNNKDIEYNEGLHYKLINNGTEYRVVKGSETQAEIIIPDTYKNLPITEIGYGAFSAYIALTDITIGENVTTIGNQAFWNCTSLTSITIGNSVTSIGGSAFESCTSLTDIYYNGTIAEWNAIEKASGWDSSIGNYTVHCSDGDIAKS